MGLSLRHLWLLLLALVSVPEPASASGCGAHYALLSTGQTHLDSSVELEMRSSYATLAWITTTDGTTGPLLKGIKPPTDFTDFVTHLKGQPGHAHVTPETVPWDSLGEVWQRKLIAHAGSARGQDFFDNRQIPGIKIRDHIRVNFDRPTMIQGKKYSPGINQVPTHGLFGKVEYGNPESLQNGGLLEFHLRGNRSAGDMALEAWRIQDSSEAGRTHLHVHIVAKLPVEKLRSDPFHHALEMGDYFRRLNMHIQIEDALQGVSHTTIERGDVMYYDTLRAEDLRGVTNYFYGAGKSPRLPSIGDKFKFGLAGMRGSDKYDQPGLWGIEYRAIGSSSHSPQQVKTNLDNVQNAITTQNYGHSLERLKEWARKFSPKTGKKVTPGALLSKFWFNVSDKDVWKIVPKDRLSAVNPRMRAKVEEGIKRTPQIRLVLNDWSKDPLFFDRPDLLKKIEAAQKEAFSRLRQEDQATLTGVTKSFLVDSGIAAEVAKSVRPLGP